MSSLVVVTPPASEPVRLREVKRHLRVDDIEDDDSLIATYAMAARELAESETGRSFINKGYCQSHDHFPRRHEWTDRGTGYWFAAPRYSHRRWDHKQQIKLLRSPLAYVDRIVYLDVTGTPQTLLPTPELWQPGTEYAVGDRVQDSNGNLQQITAVDDSKANKDGTFSSGLTIPPWSAVLNGTAIDGPFTWGCIKIPAPAGDFLVDRDSEPPRITPLFGAIWPVTMHVEQAVKIYFTSGYGDTGESVPATAKVLIMQMAGNWNENRESVTPDTLKMIPNHLVSLVWSMKVDDYDPTP